MKQGGLGDKREKVERETGPPTGGPCRNRRESLSTGVTTGV